MKFYFTELTSNMNHYANVEVPMDELEEYFCGDRTGEDSIIAAAQKWFDANGWKLEKTDDGAVEISGTCTAETQEAHERWVAEFIAAIYLEPLGGSRYLIKDRRETGYFANSCTSEKDGNHLTGENDCSPSGTDHRD